MKLVLTVPYSWDGSRNVLLLQIHPEYKQSLDEIVRQCLKGGLMSAELYKPRKPRTTGAHSQNAHLNGHIQQICTETGNDFDDVKLYVKRMAFRRGLPFRVREDGTPLLSMIDHEPIPISEADMSTIECGYCIDEVHQLAAELGIVLWESELQGVTDERTQK